MDRSPGFGSYACNYCRAFHTRFPCGSVPEVLNLAAYINSPDRSTKSTTSTSRSLCACKHKVSGSLSLPSRGSFHRSFTVLVLYRSSGSILAWRVVPPSSVWIPRVRTYSGSRPILSASLTGFSPSMIGLPMPFCSPVVSLCGPYPGHVSVSGLAFLRFRSPLLTQSRLITFPAPT